MKQAQKDLFINLYQNGKTVSEIAKEYNVSYQKVYGHVKDLMPRRRTYKDFTESDLNNIVELYLKHSMSTEQIAQQFNTNRKTVSRLLNQLHIERSAPSRRTYKLNEHYFDQINTPTKAYILGLLYADGYNSLTKSTIAISLQEEDKDLLEQIRKELESEKELEFLDYSNKHDFGYNYKNQYRLLFFSKHMCTTLNNYGMIPNKSLQLQFPNISSDLYSHFIRGYFDGDGSFCIRQSQYGVRSLITFTSTYEFCQRIQQIFQTVLQVPAGNIYDASCHNGITKVLSIGGTRQNKIILDWLYKDASIYMERKYQYYLSNFYSHLIKSA